MLEILATEFKVTVSTATGAQAVVYVCNIFLIYLFIYPPPTSHPFSLYLASRVVLCRTLIHERPALPPAPLWSIPLSPSPPPAAEGAVPQPCPSEPSFW